MGIIYDFETGVKTEPPCECEDGVGLPVSSNPFPWIKIISEADGGFVRVQLSQDDYEDFKLTSERAMGLCTDLALIATKLLRDGK